MDNGNKKLNSNYIETILSLAPMQEGILFHYLLDKEADCYLEQLKITVMGKLDAVIFEKAWNMVAEANEMLRTVFRWENLNNPVQAILKNHNVKVIVKDLSENVDTESAVMEAAQADRKEYFNLTEVPFRVTLCKLSGTRHVILIANHHILYDGWSNGVILKEFFETYYALAKQEIMVE